MNNNLEFENKDPSPDSIEDNHPRTNYGEGFYRQETLEEAFKKWSDTTKIGYDKIDVLQFGAKWQQEQDKNKYSEEDMIKFAFDTYHYISKLMGVPFNQISENKLHAMYNFEQFKKK
jgi:predicted amino acid racemase